MEDFIMKPKVDMAFKEIMMDEKARIGFLSAMLKIRPEDIKETRILNANLRKGHEDDKQGILDVRILMNDAVEINVEIQLTRLKVWANRALFYLAKMYADQIAPKQNYGVFKKCVSISILDFKLFPEEEDFYSCFHIREDTRNFIYTDKMPIAIIGENNLLIGCKNTIRIQALLCLFGWLKVRSKQGFLNSVIVAIPADFDSIGIFSHNFICREPIYWRWPFCTCLNAVKNLCVFCDWDRHFIQSLEHCQKLKVSCQSPWQLVQYGRIKLNRTHFFARPQFVSRINAAVNKGCLFFLGK